MKKENSGKANLTKNDKISYRSDPDTRLTTKKASPYCDYYVLNHDDVGIIFI